MLDDLRRLNRMYRFHSGDVILFNSLRQWPLRALVEWLEELPSGQAPALVIVLHYTPDATPNEVGPEQREYQQGFERMAASPVRRNFVLMTDSRELREQFARISPISVGLLPIPHCEDVPAVRKSEVEEITFTYVGEARTDKGFHLLPDLVSALISSEGRRVQFSIQSHSSRNDDVAIEEARDRLEQFEQVDLIRGALTDQEYRALLGEADVILLPYLQRHYHAQTSGIFAEAISSGTPVIVPSGTWMAAQAQEYGVGIVFESENLDSLIDACQKAIETVGDLRARSAAAAITWREVHNAASFIAKLQDSMREVRLGAS